MEIRSSTFTLSPCHLTACGNMWDECGHERVSVSEASEYNNQPATNGGGDAGIKQRQPSRLAQTAQRRHAANHAISCGGESAMCVATASTERCRKVISYKRGHRRQRQQQKAKVSRFECVSSTSRRQPRE